MASVNITVRVDEEVKKEFDEFCDNVGMNMTTAFNMFIKATLRTRELPFVVADFESQRRKQAKKELKEVIEVCQRQSVINGTDKITMDEINAEIAACRREMREQQ
jgi:DNA-damage-inducible protein J